jgi:hypothetical protein
MKNKTYLSFFFAILMMNIASAKICQDETYTANIPCTVITPIISCSTNATILNIDTLDRYNKTLNSVGDGSYNFTFNYSIGSYRITLCDNSTASIEVTQTQEIDYTGGAGFAAPDPNEVKKGIYDEIKVYVDKYGKTVKITFWIGIIALIFAILGYLDYRQKKLKRLAFEVKKEINRGFR